MFELSLKNSSGLVLQSSVHFTYCSRAVLTVLIQSSVHLAYSTTAVLTRYAFKLGAFALFARVHFADDVLCFGVLCISLIYCSVQIALQSSAHST